MSEVPPMYLEDASGLQGGHAERIYTPSTDQEIAGILREAAAARTPVTVSGAGTGVAGGRVPFGGWVVSLEKFNRIEVFPGYAIAGAGALLRDVHAAALASGQLYPPDPTETGSTIGGNIACNASGSRSFRYGATGAWIERLRVVLADGRILDVGRGEPVDFDPGTVPQPAVTKNTAGYLLRSGMDWVDLFTGSEGTLGVVTEARLRLRPAPKAVLAGIVFFPSDEAALRAVDEWRTGSTARMLEYFDEASLGLLRARFGDIPKAARAAVLFDQEMESEDDPEVDAWLERLEGTGALAEESWFATTLADRERFRKFRHALPELVNDTVRRAGAMKMGTDFAVPLDRNREMLAYYRRRLEEEFAGRYVIFGHIGDAHVHVNVFSDPANPQAAVSLITEFARHAVSLGGTVSAEHGVGKRKAALLKLQYSEEQLAAMRAVKRRMDPANILGRGTMLV
ncbi:MAG: FAD-binding oxidoreductase [Candidatus Solibacter sp.]